MILYSLACDAGHRFESWFANSGAFDVLASQSSLACPTCGSPHVAKTIMAPAVFATRAATPPAPEPTPRDATSEPAKPPSSDVALLDTGRRELRSMIKAFREKVLADTQDVGTRFPDEARRMHKGDIPHREIRGQATIDEARALLEDGIGVLPLPVLPDDMN